MSDSFSQRERPPGTSKPFSMLHGGASFLSAGLRRGVRIVIVLAFGSGALLLATDLPRSAFLSAAHAPISALPLLLIGLAALGFQVILRPNWLDLFKALIVIVAFLLWGVDQLLPTGWLTTTLGDLVIVLYVIDLGWMMADRLHQSRRSQLLSQDQPSSSPVEGNLSECPTQPLRLLPIPHSFPDAPQNARLMENSSPAQFGPEPSTRSAPALKRHRLLPLSNTSQKERP